MNIIEQHELIKEINKPRQAENSIETIQDNKINHKYFVLYLDGREYPGFYIIAVANGIISEDEYDECMITGDFYKYACIHLNGDTMDLENIIIIPKKKLHNQLFLKSVRKYKEAVVEEYSNGKIKSYKLNKEV